MDYPTITQAHTARRPRRTIKTLIHLPAIVNTRLGTSDVRIKPMKTHRQINPDIIKGTSIHLSIKSPANKSTKSSTSKLSTNDSTKSTAPYSNSSYNKTVSSFDTEASFSITGFHEG